MKNFFKKFFRIKQKRYGQVAVNIDNKQLFPGKDRVVVTVKEIKKIGELSKIKIVDISLCSPYMKRHIAEHLEKYIPSSQIKWVN